LQWKLTSSGTLIQPDKQVRKKLLKNYIRIHSLRIISGKDRKEHSNETEGANKL